MSTLFFGEIHGRDFNEYHWIPAGWTGSEYYSRHSDFRWWLYYCSVIQFLSCSHHEGIPKSPQNDDTSTGQLLYHNRSISHRCPYSTWIRSGHSARNSWYPDRRFGLRISNNDVQFNKWYFFDRRQSLSSWWYIASRVNGRGSFRNRFVVRKFA